MLVGSHFGRRWLVDDVLFALVEKFIRTTVEDAAVLANIRPSRLGYLNLVFKKLIILVLLSGAAF